MDLIARSSFPRMLLIGIGWRAMPREAMRDG